MKRSMESILSDEPTVHDLPDEQGSDSHATETTETVTPAKGKPGVGAPPAPKASDAVVKGKTTGKTPEPDDEDAEEEHVPDDLDGFKRALAAARGDKRKARKKWQEVERKLAEAEGRLAVYQAQGSPKPSEAPKPPAELDLTDEEFFGKGPEAVKAYVARVLEKREMEARQRRLVHSEARARKAHPDFQDKFNLFQQSAPPHVVQQVLEDDDPAEALYSYATTIEQFQGVSSPEEYRQKVEAEIRAKLEAEYAAARPRDDEPEPEHVPAKPPPPRSLAGARGSGSGTPQAWTGPQPLENLFK